MSETIEIIQQQGIHLTCPYQGERELLRGMIADLDTLLDEQETLAGITDYGGSYQRQSCYVDLWWLGEVNPAFIEQLQADPRITTVNVYTIAALPDEHTQVLATAPYLVGCPSKQF